MSTELNKQKNSGHDVFDASGGETSIAMARNGGRCKKITIPILCFVIATLLQSFWFIDRVGALSIPDPDMHALATYALATGQGWNPTTTETDHFGNQVRTQRITGDSRYLYVEGRQGLLVDSAITASQSGDSAKQAQVLGSEHTAKTVTIPSLGHPNRSNQYIPFLYIPQAVGLSVAMSLDLPAYQGWQLSRITNLLCYLILFSCAIALAPRGRWFLVCLGSLPYSVFMASSLMIDGIVTAICALFVAAVMHFVLKNRSVSTFHVVGLAALAFMVVCAKMVYFPIVAIALCIPNALLNVRKKCLFMILWISLVLSVFLPWYTHYSGTLALANISGNIEYVIANPLHVITLMATTLLALPSSLPVMPMMQMACSILICLGIMTLYRSDASRRVRAPWLSRYRYAVVGIVSVAASVAMMLLFLALTWNVLPSLEAEFLQGFQERYLLPVIPVMLVCFTIRPGAPSQCESEHGVSIDSRSFLKVER
ncbi:DUF2142 domain-containing protein [Bifidobacterium crudilactis]|jgi:hypothetical protein|uniref:DUF2142 domain-containing protein n=1 Tax=Bifidobacterium crudilactis TaxID=327277 RepID=UPI002F352D7E|nr:DUF2142 domain-containing protein [Bifidobacterium crudilactis]